MFNKRIYLLVLMTVIALLTACTATQINHSATPYWHPQAPTAVLLFENHTETPLAGERATAVTASLLESHGVHNLIIYQRPANNTLFPGITRPIPKPVLIAWARERGAHYAMTGSVNEWTYKVGLDGEPVVGITLELLDTDTGEIIWTAVGSKSGGSRVAVSTVAQSLINQMLMSLFNGYPA